jgi:hypothetical protein
MPDRWMTTMAPTKKEFNIPLARKQMWMMRRAAFHMATTYFHLDPFITDSVEDATLSNPKGPITVVFAIDAL